MRIYTEYAVLLLMVVQFAESNMNCNETYMANGHLCYPCIAGFYLLSNCVNDNQMARCERCGSGYYQPNCNVALTCEKCSLHCPDMYMEQIKDCTVEADRVCECANEMFWYKDGANDGFCKKHSLCDPGTGLLEAGSAVSNTICSSCIIGETFSETSSLEKCTKCTNCSVFLKPCTTTSDAVCSNGTDYSTTSIIVATSNQSGLTTTTTTALLVTLPIALTLIAVLIYICYMRRRRWINYLIHLAPNTNHTLAETIESNARNGLMVTRQSAESLLQNDRSGLQHPEDEISASESSDDEHQDTNTINIGDSNTETNTLPIGKDDERLSHMHYCAPDNATLTTTDAFTSTSSNVEHRPTIHMTNGGSHACRTDLTEQDGHTKKVKQHESCTSEASNARTEGAQPVATWSDEPF